MYALLAARPSTRRIAMLLLIAIATMVLAAHARMWPHPAQATAGGQAVSFTQIQSEFTAESAALSLPMAQGWPSTGVGWMLAPDVDRHAAVFQSGFGQLVADTVWLCSWEREAIRLRSQSSDLGPAIQSLEAFPNMHAYQSSWDDTGRDLFTGRLSALRRGEVAAMIRDVGDNCGPATAAHK